MHGPIPDGDGPLRGAEPLAHRVRVQFGGDRLNAGDGAVVVLFGKGDRPLVERHELGGDLLGALERTRALLRRVVREPRERDLLEARERERGAHVVQCAPVHHHQPRRMPTHRLKLLHRHFR